MTTPTVSLSCCSKERNDVSGAYTVCDDALLLQDKSDIFSIFAKIILETMDKEQLRVRVLELETRRDKMFHTLASFQSLQKELKDELCAAHSELADVRNKNFQLKEKVRQLQAQLALTSL